MYHLSATPLAAGTVLESRFGTSPGEQRTYGLIRSALAEGPSVLKSLLLGEALFLTMSRSEGPVLYLPMHLKESVLEQVRISEFPDKPPRLGGVFLCPTLNDMDLFRKTFPERQYLYFCKIEGGVQVTLDLMHVATVDILLPVSDQLRQLMQRARRYWNGDHSDNPIMEIVTNGTVTIIHSVAT